RSVVANRARALELWAVDVGNRGPEPRVPHPGFRGPWPKVQTVWDPGAVLVGARLAGCSLAESAKGCRLVLRYRDRDCRKPRSARFPTSSSPSRRGRVGT